MTWDVGYREWAPPPGLSGIACLWARVVAPGGAETALVLPDGCADLIWRQGGEAVVAGPDTGPVPAPLPPGAVLVGARFRPGAGGPALGLPLNTLLDQRVEVAALHPGLAPRLDGGLSPARALDGILAVAAELVTARPPDRLVGHAAHLLASPTARVEALARELALSERQLRRRFEAAIGYGPKTLQRVLRIRRFLARVDADEDPPDLASAAADAGYADQAHLTRESTRLAGLPPAALLRSRRAPTSTARSAVSGSR